MGRSFPNKVWIELRERKADAVITDTRDYCLVQADGLMFHKVDGPVNGLMLIEVARPGPIRPGVKSDSQSRSRGIGSIELCTQAEIASKQNFG